MLQGGSSASVGGGGAGATELVCSGVEVATVVVGSGIGRRGSNGCGSGRRGCDGEGAACVCAREMGVTLM